MFEQFGYNVHAVKTLKMSLTHCRKLYACHTDKTFYQTRDLEDEMISGLVMPMILIGNHDLVVEQVRVIIGAADPDAAEQGTVRRTFGLQLPKNTIHGSDCNDVVSREISIFFKSYEVPIGGPEINDLRLEDVE